MIEVPIPMSTSSRQRTGHPTVVTHLEPLETRWLLSAAFDVTGLTALRANPSYSQVTGAGVGIAVLDTGVYAQNPDLSANVVAFYNAVKDPVSTTNTSVVNAIDHDGHGSHVAGIAASSNPAIGVAYGAKIVDVRVLPDQGESQLGGDPVLRGLQWVANNYQQYNIKVVNMSLGTPGLNENTVSAADQRDSETLAIRTLEALGITVVTASGNSYANDPVPGASFPAVVSTISVANTWADRGQAADFQNAFGGYGDQYYAEDFSAAPDTFASTSQRSTLPNQVAAPGQDIYSTWNGTHDSSNGTDLLHNTISGTSMAAPFVSGVVALMQQAAKTFSGHYLANPAQIRQILQQSADTVVDANNPNNARVNVDTNATSNLPETGLSFKRVDVLKAIALVQQVVTGNNPNVGPAPGPDTDNTAATAFTVPDLDGTRVFNFDGSVGTDGNVIVSASDVDLYRLNVTSVGSLTVALAQQAGGTNFALSLRLFDANGKLLTSKDGTAGAYPTLTSGKLAAGVYYLGVSGAGNGAYHIDGSGAAAANSPGDYAVTFTLQNPDPNGVIQGAFAVDLTQTNETLTDQTTGTQYTNVVENGLLGSDPPPTGSNTRITVSSDVDMYSIVAPDTGKLLITTDTSGYSKPADTYLKVFDASGAVITANDNAGALTTDSAITLSVTAGTTYYVAVTVPQNASAKPTDPYAGRAVNATPSDVAYDLHLRFDNGDTNGTAVNPVSATIGTAFNGSIGADNGVALLGANGGSKDVDFFQYFSSSGGLLDVSAASTTSGFTPVVSLWEFTQGQTDIVKVADTTNLPSPHLIDQIGAGQSFFVAVTGMGNNDFNWYSVASGSGGQTGAYTLNSSLRSLSDLATLSDNAINGGSPGAISAGQSVKGNLGADGNLVVGAADVDLYRLVAPATETLDIRTNTNQEGSADTVLRVFDASGNPLAANDNVDATTTASRVKVSVQAGQTYYIGVSGAGASALTYNPVTGAGEGDGSTGNYTLSVAAAMPGFSVADPTPTAAYAGATLDFTVTLDQPLAATATVGYATVDGTAVAGTDYTAASGTLTFAPGVTSQTIRVPVLPNAGASGNRTFTLKLSSPSGAQVASDTATGTIQDVAVSTLTFKAGKSVGYTHSAGRPVGLYLSGPGTGTAIFVGGSQDPARITLSDTAANTTFTIRGSGAVVGDIVANGSVGAISAAGTSLTGGVSVAGSLAKLTLGDVAGGAGGGAIAIGAAGAAPLDVMLGHVSNEGFTTPGAIGSLSVKNWLNSGGGAVTINATSIGAIKSAGDFSASLSAAALGPVKVAGSLTGGNWSISGAGAAMTIAGAANAGWSATFGGDLGSLRFGNFAGALTANAIASLKVAGNLAGATIRLTSTSGLALGSLTVGNAVTDTQIRTAANVGKVTVGGFLNSTLFAGVGDATTSLPTDAAAFTADASILSFTVTGRAKPYAFASSNVAAASIGKVTLLRASGDNAGTPFGFAAKSLGAFSNAKVLKWTSKQSPNLLAADGDLVVRLLT